MRFSGLLGQQHPNKDSTSSTGYRNRPFHLGGEKGLSMGYVLQAQEDLEI
jgi:hypothetical protein